MKMLCKKRVDRLSDLPDELLLQILSLVSTKSAVMTSVLSKRWSGLWTSIADLRFDREEFTFVTSFLNFVHRVLILRGRSNVRQFELRWYQDFDMSTTAAWMDYAMDRNVQELVLSITPDDYCLLPARLLRYGSLERWLLDVVNKIGTVEVHNVLFPVSLNMNKLKVLHIQSVECSAGMVQDLIFGCPALEELKITVDVTHEVLQVYAPNLRRLELNCVSNCTISEIRVWAPRLGHLSCCFHGFLPEFSIRSLHLFAEVHLWSSMILLTNGKRIAAIFGGLCKAKSLTLVENVIETLATVLDFLEATSLQFSNLKYLKMEAWPSEHHIRVISIMLKSAPNLEKLVIENTTGACAFEYDWTVKKPKYGCSLDHLKEIVINGFFGSIDELELVNYLLNSATTLRTMDLNYVDLDYMDRNGIYEKLLTVPRASLTARILLTASNM